MNRVSARAATRPAAIPMAANRMNRTFLPPADSNPLAPAKPGAAYSDGEIPAEDYDVVVFENRFPSFVGAPTESTVDGLFEHHPAWGLGQVPAQLAHKRGLPHGASPIFGAAHQHQHRPGRDFPDPGHGPEQDMDTFALPEFPGEDDGGFVLKAILLPNLSPLGLMVPN